MNHTARFLAAAQTRLRHRPACWTAQLARARHPRMPRLQSTAAMAAAPVDVEEPKEPETTFFRRPLPLHLVSFNSPDGKRLFRESLEAGFAELYFQLVGNFTAQTHPAYCGLGSLAMVLNAVEVDPGRPWKGVWRWYSDENLECCAPRDVVQRQGVSFREFACLARCNGLSVEAKRQPHVSFDEFVDDVRLATRSTDTHLVVNFSRAALGQTGGGHFSPVAAYHPNSVHAGPPGRDRGMALVLDTARFKYPPYFCDLRTLFDSMRDVDPDTRLPRGYFVLRRMSARAPMAICKLATRPMLTWDALGKLFCSALPRNLYADPPASAADAVARVVALLPEPYRAALQIERGGVDRAGHRAERKELERASRRMAAELLAQVRSLPLYSVVHDKLASAPDASAVPLGERAALLTVLVLAIPPESFATLAPAVLAELNTLCDLGSVPTIAGLDDAPVPQPTRQLLRKEVARIRSQLESLMQSFCECGRRHFPQGHVSPSTLPAAAAMAEHAQRALSCTHPGP